MKLLCRFLFLFIIRAITFAELPAEAGRPPERKRPNVVIYITDDESWLERSIYGWSNLPTPNFDRVAREGVVFTHTYTVPSCAPSRASLLTGRNFWELEQGAFIQAWLPKKFAVLPDMMEAAGYLAGYTGKGWGPGVSGDRQRNPAGEAYNQVRRKVPEGITNIDYAANFENFLEQRKAGQPFWFWVGCQEPHTPLGPDNYTRLAERGVSLSQVKMPPFLPDLPGVRRNRANMLYEVCHADDDLGRILALLEKNGELENTLLIVTSDNGTEILRGKTNLYDWGTRVPMVMMWPGHIKAGRRVTDRIGFPDIAPTILEAASIPVPREVSGRSLNALLHSPASGEIDPSRAWAVSGLEWHGEPASISLAGRAIRDERYLYIVNYGASPRRDIDFSNQSPDAEFEQHAESLDEVGLIAQHVKHPALKRFYLWFVAPRPREELYDSLEDPWQLHNLADSAPHVAIKEKLRAQLEAYQRSTKDPRITGDMKLFEETRAFVLDRKFGVNGYQTKN